MNSPLSRTKKNLRIGLVELFADSVAFRVNIKFPSRAIDLLAAILRKAGYETVTTFNSLYDAKGGQISRAYIAQLAQLDIVGFSAITSTQNQAYELAESLKAINPRLWTIFGGFHASCLPEEALQHGDIAVLYEADKTIVELMDCLRDDLEHPALRDVAGIAFKDADGDMVKTAMRPFLTNDELDSLPFPVIPERILKRINCNKIITARGCPYHCSFCTINQHFGLQYRTLSIERSVELIAHAAAQFSRLTLMADDNFALNTKRAKAILELMLKKGVTLSSWTAQVRVEASKDTELLALLRRNHCRKVFVGIENINNASLEIFNKRSTSEKNEEAIRRFHEAGILVHGHFVLGTDADTAQTIRDTALFAKKLRLDTAYFLSLSPGPGSDLYQKYLSTNKLITRNWRRYDGNNVVIWPEKITPLELQQEIDRAYKVFYSLPEAAGYLFRPRIKLTTLLLRTVGYPAMRYIMAARKPYEAEMGRLQKAVAGLESRGASPQKSQVSPDFEEFWQRRQQSIQELPGRTPSIIPPVDLTGAQPAARGGQPE